MCNRDLEKVGVQCLGMPDMVGMNSMRMTEM